MNIDLPSSAAFEVEDQLYCFQCARKFHESTFVKIRMLYDECYDKCARCEKYLQ